MSDWQKDGVEIDPERGVPYFRARFLGQGNPPLIVELHLHGMPDEELRIIATSVELAESKDVNTGISSGRLKEIPYGHLTFLALSSLRHPSRAKEIYGIQDSSALGKPEDVRRRHDFDALRKEWPKGDVPKVSKAVADVYESSTAIGLPPKKEIADYFSVSTATAGRMIAKARELGMLHSQSAVGRPKKGSTGGTTTFRKRRTGGTVHKESEQQTLKVSRSRKGRVR